VQNTYNISYEYVDFVIISEIIIFGKARFTLPGNRSQILFYGFSSMKKEQRLNSSVYHIDQVIVNFYSSQLR